MPSNEDEIRRQCDEIVERLFAHYGIGLLTREELLERSMSAYAHQPSEDLSYLIFGLYNQALHQACSGDEGPLRWEQGYTELYSLLAARARYRYPDVWEDAVQIAIEVTCKRFERCRVPNAFFLFAWNYLRTAVRSLRAENRLRGEGLEISMDAPQSHLLLSDLIADPAEQVEQLLLSAEQRAELAAILSDFEREHPRAARQLAAVRMKYLDGLEDQAIGEVLGIPVKRVHELRSLGLRKLRADPRLRQLFSDDDDEGENLAN